MSDKQKFYVSERVLAELGEHILLAARRLTDEHGHRLQPPYPREIALVADVAQRAIAEITGCEIEKRDAIDG